jgi:hypothetical protein
MAAIAQALQHTMTSKGSVPKLLFLQIQVVTIHGLQIVYATPQLGIPRDTEIVTSKFLPCKAGDCCMSKPHPFVWNNDPFEIFCRCPTTQQCNNGVTQLETQMVQATTFCEDRLQQYPSLQMAIIVGDFNSDDKRK